MLKIKIFIITILFFVACIFIYNNSLLLKLKKFLTEKNTNAGVAIIKNDKIWSNNHEKYPLLSVFKYFVAVKVLTGLEQKQISQDKKITITAEMIDKSLYSPMLKKYSHCPFEISIAELLMYMISKSDNNACDILIEYSGGIDELSEFIHSLGFEDIEISVNEKEMNPTPSKQYLNKAYPEDIIKFMKYVNEENLLSEKSLNFLHKILEQTTTGKDKLKAGLPANIILCHKTGSGSRLSNGIKIADNDAGYVLLPDGEIYYIVVMIKNSKLTDKENAEIISGISKIVYEHFTIN